MTLEERLIIPNNHLQLSKLNTIECLCSQKCCLSWTNGCFWLWISFFASERWDNQLLCHFRSLKWIEHAIVAPMLSTNVTLLILEVFVPQTEGRVNVFPVSCFLPLLPLGTRDTTFYPVFFNFDHKFHSVDCIWADQAPSRFGTRILKPLDK